MILRRKEFTTLEVRRQSRITSEARVVIKEVASKGKTLKTFLAHSLGREADSDNKVDLDNKGLAEVVRNSTSNLEAVNSNSSNNSQKRSLHPTYLEAQMSLN